MPRQRLPARRRAVLLTCEHRGSLYDVAIGAYDDDRPDEMFITGVRAGSDIDALLNDAAILISLALQNGVHLADLARSMGREGDRETPSSIIGAALDRAAVPK